MLSATYSPEDNKLRLYSSARLDAETYGKVKSAGFAWAPKQELFVAPAWTPSREDLLTELCGEIGDEDTSLVERAEDRAERFGDYSEKRAQDAEQARQTVAAIADNIPLGQPILIGHHSERHARKDAERIENGMRRAVRMWETSRYWQQRAAGAIRAAKYKEQPSVRARRIKGLESDRRKQEREKAGAEKWLSLWSADGLTLERAKALTNYDRGGVTLPSGEHYWSAWGALEDGKITPEQVREQRLTGYPRIIAHCERWIAHIDHRLDYERAMLAESGGTVADRNRPEKGGGCRCWASPRGGWSYIHKVNRVSVTVLDNWGNGGENFTRTIPLDKLSAVMSRAEVDAKRNAGQLVESHDKTGFFLLNTPAPDAMRSTPPEAPASTPEFEAMREQLKTGVHVVTAPQLFPTPQELAERMAALADLRACHAVLEPSAGTGALVRAILRSSQVASLTAVEIHLALADRLRASPGFEAHTSNRVIGADFLQCNGNLGQFDRIVMNPPFANGQDIAHIEHALTMLAPGGRLVAICANGPRQNEQLRPLVEERGGTWEELPVDTFKQAGTEVRAVLLTIDAD